MSSCTRPIEAAFAAGYLAAGVSETGVLCTYGGANFPTVAIFMDGFTRGATYYNEVKGTDVTVLGWDVDAADGLFTGSFTDMDLARSTAESLFQESCDIIIPVGGAINLPAGDAINDSGITAALVGVDVDAYFAMDEQYQSLWLTTVVKAIGPLVTLSVQQQAEDSWTRRCVRREPGERWSWAGSVPRLGCHCQRRAEGGSLFRCSRTSRTVRSRPTTSCRVLVETVDPIEIPRGPPQLRGPLRVGGRSPWLGNYDAPSVDCGRPEWNSRCVGSRSSSLVFSPTMT